jgi:hypothetical protein
MALGPSQSHTDFPRTQDGSQRCEAADNRTIMASPQNRIRHILVTQRSFAFTFTIRVFKHGIVTFPSFNSAVPP